MKNSALALTFQLELNFVLIFMCQSKGSELPALEVLAHLLYVLLWPNLDSWHWQRAQHLPVGRMGFEPLEVTLNGNEWHGAAQPVLERRR